MSARHCFIWPLSMLLLACGSPSNPVANAPATDAKPAAKVTKKTLLRKSSPPLVMSIFYLPIAKGDPVATVTKLAQGLIPNLRIVPTGSEETTPHPSVHVVTMEPKPEWIPDAEALSYFGRGLSEEQAKLVQESSEMLSVAFYAEPKDMIRIHALALRIMAAAAEDTGGLLWDTETREMFTLTTWRKRSDVLPPAAPDVATVITSHGYQEGELIRIVTLGMSKFGYPDVVVNRVPRSLSSDMSALINLACQTIVERGSLDADGRLTLDLQSLENRNAFSQVELMKGGTGKLVVQVAEGKREDGDPDNRLLEIVFPGPDAQLGERQAAALARLWGRDNQVLDAPSQDAELEAASKRARAKLLRDIKPRWQGKPPERHRLLVKAPFDAPDGQREFMWVEVVRWQGTTIHGLLMNRPKYIETMKQGARVQVDESVVFDYQLDKPDGTYEGNETTKILMRRRDR